MALASSAWPTVAVSERVAAALRDRAPVVALESTIITHGLPRPENAQAAREFERTVIDHGAVPATIAVLDGVPHVGLEPDQLERLVSAGSPHKLSARDLPLAMAQRATGGTTVAATALLASRVGIRVFATGGIGGVHRGAGTTFDESADLAILANRRITVVSAGVKSILDIGATLERLETLGVTVLAFGTNRFPAFWLTDGGYTVDAVGTVEQVAEVMRARDALDLPGGILVATSPSRTCAARPRSARPAARRGARCRRGPIDPWQGDHPLPAGVHPRTHGPDERQCQPRDRPGQLPARRRHRPCVVGAPSRNARLRLTPTLRPSEPGGRPL
jgi:pseudouridine-5'-phosphate glycosidase